MSARPVWTVERWKVVSKLKNQPNKKITLSNSSDNNSNTTEQRAEEGKRGLSIPSPE